MTSPILLLTAFAFCVGFPMDTKAQQSIPGAPVLQSPLYIPPSAKGGRKVTGKETQGHYTAQEVVVQPGEGPPRHRHSREDEGFYVLEGQYEFKLGDQVIVASAGSFLFAPRGIPHTYKNVGTTPSRHVTIISPGGLEKMFEELAALRKERPTTDPEYKSRYTAIYEKYGVEYLE